MQTRLKLKERLDISYWQEAAPTKELTIETMEKLIQEGNLQRSVAKDVSCSQSAVSKIQI